VRLLLILASWTALSVPVSVATGCCLAAGQAGQPRPLAVRSGTPAQAAASVSAS